MVCCAVSIPIAEPQHFAHCHEKRGDRHSLAGPAGRHGLAVLPGAGPRRPASQCRHHSCRRSGLGRSERQRQHAISPRRTSIRWRATARCSSGSSSAPSARPRGPSSSPAAIIRAAACSARLDRRRTARPGREDHRASTFKAAGYATGAFGKWHNGTQYPYHPNARGFDEFYGFCSGHWGNYFDPLLEHNGQTGAWQGLHHRRPHRPRAGVHRATSRRAVLLLPAVQHAPLAHAGAGPFLSEVRRRRAASCALPEPTRKRICPSPARPWPCARTSTGTWAASWQSSTS